MRPIGLTLLRNGRDADSDPITERDLRAISERGTPRRRSAQNALRQGEPLKHDGRVVAEGLQKTQNAQRQRAQNTPTANGSEHRAGVLWSSPLPAGACTIPAQDL